VPPPKPDRINSRERLDSRLFVRFVAGTMFDVPRIRRFSCLSDRRILFVKNYIHSNAYYRYSWVLHYVFVWISFIFKVQRIYLLSLQSFCLCFVAIYLLLYTCSFGRQIYSFVGTLCSLCSFRGRGTSFDISASAGCLGLLSTASS